MINRIENDNSDIVFIGFYKQYNNGEIYENRYYDKCIVSKQIKHYCLDLYKRDLFGYTWCKMFKSCIIKKFNLKFDKEMHFCEDELFTCEYCKYIKRISIENRPLYHYIDYQGDRENLCSKKRNEILNAHKLFNGWFRFLGNHDEKYLENKAYTTIKYLYFRELWSDKSFKTKKSNIKKIKQTSIMKYIKSNKNLNKKILVKSIEYESIVLFKLIFRIFNKLKIVNSNL